MNEKQNDLTKKRKLEQALVVARGQKKVKLHEKYINGDE